jgi:hypothetical protein
MSRRFYIQQCSSYWSLSKQGYLKLLQDGATAQKWELSNIKYEARTIKKPPPQAKPINVTDFDTEHYQLELEHFLKTGHQTGFNIDDYIDIFFGE